jgi:CHASE2 domain-containing sensor protein
MRSIFSSRWRPSLSTLFPLGAAGLLVIGLGQLGLLLPLVQAEYGLRFRLRGQQPWSEEVILIAIDDPSLAALGAFPWRRQHYADLLEQMQGYPSVVVFDLLFSDPSPDDGEFARAIAAHPASFWPSPGIVRGDR